MFDDSDLKYFRKQDDVDEKNHASVPPIDHPDNTENHSAIPQVKYEYIQVDEQFHKSILKGYIRSNLGVTVFAFAIFIIALLALIFNSNVLTRIPPLILGLFSLVGIAVLISDMIKVAKKEYKCRMDKVISISDGQCKIAGSPQDCKVFFRNHKDLNVNDAVVVIHIGRELYIYKTTDEI